MVHGDGGEHARRHGQADEDAGPELLGEEDRRKHVEPAEGAAEPGPPWHHLDGAALRQADPDEGADGEVEQAVDQRHDEGGEDRLVERPGERRVRAGLHGVQHAAENGQRAHEPKHRSLLSDNAA